MKRTLPSDSLQEVRTRLEQAHKAFAQRYPGAPAERQPIHVVYGGAHLFRGNTARRFGEMALRSMDEYAPDFSAFAKALGLPGADALPDSAEAAAAIAKAAEGDPAAVRRENRPAWFAHTVFQRVREKLRREAVEDFRIDFEDGYGIRPDDEEDAHAAAAAKEVGTAKNDGQLPAFIGIRIKPFTEELRERSVRTLDIFLTELAEKTRGELPNVFYVTLPKVTMPDEVAALADICSQLEPMLDLEPGALRIEIMIETPQAIFNERGEANLLPLVSAARGRCAAAHFGPFDYTASRNIASVHQPIRHFASDFAREVMQVALAGTGIRLADGPTNIMPIPPHRAKDGVQLTLKQAEENRAAVHRAWKIHFENIGRSLGRGFYQGWDLHPAQLPARYAAVYAFFLENLEPAAERLRNFVEKAAQATRVGQVFDDAAMAQGLVNYFRQAINCGALAAEEVQALTGVSEAGLRGGSFAKILENRR
jgi:citrate lyase beta subunit